jgi:hypothetical protein
LRGGQGFLPGVQTIAVPGHTLGHTIFMVTAAAKRVKLLDMIAANKTPVMSYHFARPGYGHIARTGEGFHYYPPAMLMKVMNL